MALPKLTRTRVTSFWSALSMQSYASPNGSVASPDWQPITLPGLPCSGKRGQQPAAPVVEVTARQVAGHAPPTSLHCPATAASVSSCGVQVADVSVIGSGYS